MNKKSYFRSCGYIPEAKIETDSGATIDLTEVPTFLRTLLVTDGTVTKTLEAWFWEPIKVQALSNTLETLSDIVDGLEVEVGDRVLQREVMLKGEHSDKVFACARSTVSLKHLPKEIGTALETGKIGIGELLREKGVETYRDIFNINYLKNIPERDILLSKLQDEVVSRSYRIRVNGHPAIIVTEFFPLGIY